MKYKLIIFDWDGTLYDSSGFIVSCVQAAARDLQMPVPAAENIKQMIGLSSTEALKRLAPELTPAQNKALQNQFYERMATSKLDQPMLFNGAVDTLQHLAELGYWLAIATSKSRKGLEYDLEELALKHLFMTTRTADDAQSKPHPQMVLDILNELGMSATDALMIGDTEYDMQMAENANIDALAVSYGAHSLDQLKRTAARGYIHDIKELPIWLVDDPLIHK